MNYYEHHIGDYAAATAHLSLVEDAIYSRMLRRYYLQEGPLPVSVEAIARLIGARDETEIVKAILVEFFTLSDDGWHQKRADEDISRFHVKAEKARASANARWERPNVNSECERNANASETHNGRNAHQTPDTSNQTPIEQKPSARRADDEGRFPDWWAVYPKPVKRKVALGIWRRRKLDPIADELIADVRNRVANDDGWLRGYAPDPTTYLNQDRWTDALRTAPTARAGPPAQPSKTRALIERIEGMKHGLAGTRTTDGIPETALLGIGQDPGD